MLILEGGRVKLELRFQGVRIREDALNRPTLTIARHPENDIVIDHVGKSWRHGKLTL